ncbi:MAG: DNA-formamidopyrimidine glycosylase family protein [Candidatus Rokuibacteriota bacterium]
MPELPEVEAARRALERLARGRRIVGVRCVEDRIVCEGVTPARLRRALLGRRIRAVRRRGKHLWLELDRRPWPCFHFGMTGGFHSPRAPGVRLVAYGRRHPGEVWPPRFTKLVLQFAGGREAAFADARRLGRIRLRHDPRREPPISLLGFDALLELPTLRSFADLLRERAAPIKAVLLDQSFAAGVGNWIADEVLYQAGIAPQRRANTLSDAELRRLRARIRSVIRTSVRTLNDSSRYPRTWLFHTRWDGPGAVTPRGEAIRYLTIGGRTTAWVPARQR